MESREERILIALNDELEKSAKVQPGSGYQRFGPGEAYKPKKKPNWFNKIKGAIQGAVEGGKEGWRDGGKRKPRPGWPEGIKLPYPPRQPMPGKPMPGGKFRPLPGKPMPDGPPRMRPLPSRPGDDNKMRPLPGKPSPSMRDKWLKKLKGE